MITLTQMAVNVLTTADGRAKTALSRRYAAQCADGRANTALSRGAPRAFHWPLAGGKAPH